jgi:hypothetical protein
MKIEDRIQNIKKLLSYCPKASNEVMINDETCTKFFGKFFSSQPNRFKKPEFDECRVQIELIDILDKDVRTKHYTVGLRYCYNWDREGEAWTLYYFNDPECYFREWQQPELEYFEIPNDIWEKIQNILYDKATETINKELKSAKKSVEYWEEKLFEFNYNLKLNK